MFEHRVHKWYCFWSLMALFWLYLRFDTGIQNFVFCTSKFSQSQNTLCGSCNQVRLHQNYRSTRCIVEAATALIQHNQKRCQEKQAHTDNAVGDKVSFCRFWFQAVNSSLLWTVSFQSSVHPTDSMGLMIGGRVNLSLLLCSLWLLCQQLYTKNC